jgi:hypothetical protein
MCRKLAEQVVLWVAATAAAFTVAAAIFGFVDVGTPVKVAGIVLVLGIGYWIYRNRTMPYGLWLPDPWKAGSVVMLALAVGFFLAWDEERPGGRSDFDFVVVPHRQIVASESVAPKPGTESRAAPLHGYGDHLLVTCYVRDSNHGIWYRLADQNFMSKKDLVPVPLSDGSPPPC